MIEMQIRTLIGSPGGIGTITLQDTSGRQAMVVTLAPHDLTEVLKAAGIAPEARSGPVHLLTDIVSKLGSRIERVVIHDVRDGGLIASIELRTDNGIAELECSASDGIAAAACAGCPILADETLIDRLTDPLIHPAQAEPPTCD